MCGVCLPQIPVERAEHRGGRRQDRLLPAQQPIKVDRGQQTRRRALGVALHAGQLPGEHRGGGITQRQVRSERPRGIEVRVAVNAPEPQELGIGEPRDQPKDARLLRHPEPRLEAHEVPHAPRLVFTAQLHHRPRPPPGPRIGQPDRLHRPEPQRLAPPPRHLLGRHASFEVRHRVELMRGELVGRRERVDERVIFGLVHGAVEVRASILGATLHGLLVPACLTEDDRLVDRLDREDRCDRVVERERGHAQTRSDRLGECIARERPGRDDPR